jgi:hypothetical protein
VVPFFFGLLTANQNGPALDAMRRFNRGKLDAAGVDCQAVAKRCLIEISVDWTKIGEIWSATR